MHRLSIPALAAGLLCCVAEAPAQTFSGLGPVAPLVLPGPAGVAKAAEFVPPVAGIIPVAPRAPTFRRPAASTAPLRIWGENGAITWTLFATEAEARGGGTFRIGYLAAVSILPEESRLSLALNDVALGSIPIDGTSGLRTVSVSVPPGRLVPGFNAIRIETTQRHRVDCSVAATFELWTQIDPETTGFLPTSGGLSDPSDLAAARVGADGATPIRLIQTGDRLSESGIDRVLGALQDAVLAGHIRQPAVDFTPLPEAGDGFALAVAPAGQLAGVLDLNALGPITGPRLALLPETPERRPVLVVTGATEADVAEALGLLSALRTAVPRGTPSGLRAMADAGGRPMIGGDSITLADLGFSDTHVIARTHRIAFDLALPHDILPADYDKVVLDLDASYPAGLAPGAQIVVAINGATAASAPLARSGGETLMHRAVFLPLALLRPGINRIAITAEVPRAEDATCAASSSAVAERLTLRASTRLTIPPLARIGRQPELAETLAAAFPYADGPRRPTLSVPVPDRDTMAAAATLVARLGIAAGRPIPFAFAAGRTGLFGPSLVVSAFRALDAATLASVGLDPGALKDAWSGRESAAATVASVASRRQGLQRDGLAACRAGSLGGRRIAEPAGQAAVEPRLDKASAVLVQGVTGPATDDLLTLVTAPSAAALREAVDCLVQPQVWNRPEGHIAHLSASDGSVTNQLDAPRYVATAVPSVTNLRRIAAGWLSLHAGLYGLFALLIAGGLAGSTQVLVRNLGRRSS